MESNERDESVPNEIQALLSDERLIPLCANMTETSCVTAISEQGGKENQHGNDERFCSARCGSDGSI